MKRGRTRLQIWGMPLVLGVASMNGLLWALLSDGIGDVLSWSMLAMPIAVAYCFGLGLNK
ncbi:MAG: hypothetical protein BVN35_03080 [Proteobacteria bacterium ST_bin11]|nr:MAG: hypothetical protein BVN35_03080 [Proteobacteria bacterium ST_bin11]